LGVFELPFARVLRVCMHASIVILLSNRAVPLPKSRS
jgi:hypothetical protein